MKDEKPEWYARLRKGPFEESVFGATMRQRVEERTRPGWTKMSKRRLRPWAAAGAMALFLVIAIVLIPALGHLFSPNHQAANGNGSDLDTSKLQWVMTPDYVQKSLKPGMTKEEVKRDLGEYHSAQSVKRDFPQDHREDPNDLRTWSALDIWRYDYGVRDGYEAKTGGNILDEAMGFDVPALEDGSIQSQIVIVWKERKVDRVLFQYMDNRSGLVHIQIGPGVESLPDTLPPAAEQTASKVEYANLEVRASGESSIGHFELRPKDGNPENIQLLGAPSCIGQETDFDIRGDYVVTFRTNAGDEKAVYNMNGLDMIQKENAQIKMQKLDFPDLELFLFIPRYTDCHGLELYAFGVNKKTGDASLYPFDDGKTSFPNWTTSPVNLPKAADGMLVVEGGRGAGQDGATLYRYKPDLAKRQLTLESKEHIP